MGLLFARTFMADEESALVDLGVHPHMCCHYIDDILVDVEDDTALEELKSKLWEF